MGLALVSQTYREDRGSLDPVHKPIYDLAPPLDLSRAKNFIAGQPFSAFKTMREQAPVMWHPLEKAKMEGFWALTRYEDVRAANLNTTVFSSQAGGIMMAYPPKGDPRNHPKLHSASLDTMICLDAPHHMQLRREHMAYFKPDYIRELKVKVEAKVTELLDGLQAAGPRADLDGDLSKVDPAQIMHFLTEVQAMFDYGQYILKERRKNPQNDLLSAIANVEIDGAVLPDEFLDGSWLLIVIAGNDTTRNSTSGLMKLLTQFPKQKAKVIANPDLIPNMVHEGVRMVSPVMYMRRTAVTDTEISGQQIAAGEKVIMYYGAANRDPAIFENPDIFDVTRANAKDHIAFGTGPHVCLGQRVANMQIEAAYRQILQRFPNIAWTGEEEILPNGFTHSIGTLMVDLG